MRFNYVMTKDRAIFIGGIFISILIVSASGWLYYQNSKIINKKEEIIVITTATPEPTKVPKIDYKNTEIQVLNGSGKSGLAKVYADKLEKLGYTKVITGNYEKTEGNLLFAPTDFGKDISLEIYKYQKSENIKIIIGK